MGVTVPEEGVDKELVVDRFKLLDFACQFAVFPFQNRSLEVVDVRCSVNYCGQRIFVTAVLVINDLPKITRNGFVVAFAFI